jgi:hypothetical protein
MPRSKDKQRLRGRQAQQRLRRRALDDHVEAAAALITRGERCVALYRIFTKAAARSPSYSRIAQQQAIRRLLRPANAQLIRTFDQPESRNNGRHAAKRDHLAAAIRFCQAMDAMLVIAKFSHLIRCPSELSLLAQSEIRFVACDRPDVNHRTIVDLAAAAQIKKRAMIERARANYATRKASGLRLPRYPRTPEDEAKRIGACRIRAKLFAVDFLPHVEAARRSGCKTLRQIAANLNACGIRTPRGLNWTRDNLNRYLFRGGGALIAPQIPPRPISPAEVAVDRGMPAASGFPGRPSSRAIVVDDLQRRYAAGERHPSRLGGESALAWASVLSEALASNHPSAPPATTTTVRLVISPILRRLAADLAT